MVVVVEEEEEESSDPEGVGEEEERLKGLRRPLLLTPLAAAPLGERAIEAVPAAREDVRARGVNINAGLREEETEEAEAEATVELLAPEL